MDINIDLLAGVPLNYFQTKSVFSGLFLRHGNMSGAAFFWEMETLRKIVIERGIVSLRNADEEKGTGEE